MQLSLPYTGRHQVPRYLLTFIAWLGVLALQFAWTRPVWVDVFMLPVTAAAELGLQMLGLPAQMGQPRPEEGVCTLAVGPVLYLVNFECTGIFALFLCLASILAFPASWRARAEGVAFVLPAFLAYASLRIIVLGLVAHLAPSHIELFHLYVMVVANVGFVLALWLSWLHRCAGVRA